MKNPNKKDSPNYKKLRKYKVFYINHVNFGGPAGIRTWDLCNVNATL